MNEDIDERRLADFERYQARAYLFLSAVLLFGAYVLCAWVPPGALHINLG